MINFEYYNPAKIIFGKGVENGVGREVAKYGKRVLLHYGGGSIKRNGLYDRVVTSLKAEGLYVAELGGVQPNPRLSLVRKGVEICRENRIDFILAVGGGSTIDSSKAIAAAMRCKDDIWDYYLYDDKPIEGALPVGVVLTIPAAGSESSDSSVITNEDGNYKRYIGGECLIPKFAFMNPEVTFTMPPHQIANGCSDIVAHLMERYFTRVKHVDFTDRLIEGAIRTILYHGPMALENPTDYDVRAEIMWAGTVAHNNLLNTGRIGDWASHDIERAVRHRARGGPVDRIPGVDEIRLQNGHRQVRSIRRARIRRFAGFRRSRKDCFRNDRPSRKLVPENGPAHPVERRGDRRRAPARNGRKMPRRTRRTQRAGKFPGPARRRHLPDLQTGAVIAVPETSLGTTKPESQDSGFVVSIPYPNRKSRGIPDIDVTAARIPDRRFSI